MKPATRIPVYMMHPLGNSANRERNRKLACLWQAAIQLAHPEWLVLAPWIGLSGALSEDFRDLGMQVDFATIDLCAAGVIAGPIDGPLSFTPVGGLGPRNYFGVSPGMADEIAYFHTCHSDKPIHDVRGDFKVELPPEPPFVGAENFKPRFGRFERVHVENKSGGVCHVKAVEETASGVFRYLIERTETFFAHEQSLAKIP